MQTRGIQVWSLTEEDFDWTLAEYVVDLYGSQEAAVGFSKAARLVAAVSRINPRHKYKVAWRSLDVWRNLHPPVQAPCMPVELAMAIVTWLLSLGRCQEACAILLCFFGLLRASEALRLRLSEVIRTSTGYVLVLGATKRGLEQKVEIACASVVEWLDMYSARMNLTTAARFIGISYARLNRWLRRGAEFFGFGAIRWSSHSLRRGGATELYRQNISMAAILQYGRWLTERSAREYLRKGELALLKMRNDLSADVWARVSRFAKLGANGWLLYKQVKDDSD